MDALLRRIPFLSVPETQFQAPTLLYQLLTTPFQLLLSLLHTLLLSLRGPALTPPSSTIRVVCISDTHTHQPPSLPPGDLLIHAGDLTNAGTVPEIQSTLTWLSSQPYTHIVAIAGNHDSYFDPRSRWSSDVDQTLDFGRVHYLQHAPLTLSFPKKHNGETTPGAGRKIKLYGAPQIPACGGPEHAFQYARGEDAWSGTIPADLDVLVTHTPPKWHLDLPVGVGCEFLRQEVWRARPRLHVFGHVHAGRGMETVFWGRAQEAFEAVMARQRVWDWVGVRAWVHVVRVLAHDGVGIVWSRVFGGEVDRTVMVNAAMVDYAGKLVNEAQWVDI